jgi:hypothetical protein
MLNGACSSDAKNAGNMGFLDQNSGPMVALEHGMTWVTLVISIDEYEVEFFLTGRKAGTGWRLDGGPGAALQIGRRL